MTELQYIQYFENLAVQSRVLNHDPENKKKSFFYISDPYTTTEIDNALRNHVRYPALLLDAPSGILDDNAGNNYTKNINGQFRVIAKAEKDNIRQIRDTCYNLGLDFLTRIQKDSRGNNIIFGKQISFQIEEFSYEPIGPILLNHYGYVFSFRFICPFSFSVDSSSWRDNGTPPKPKPVVKKLILKSGSDITADGTIILTEEMPENPILLQVLVDDVQVAAQFDLSNEFPHINGLSGYESATNIIIAIT